MSRMTPDEIRTLSNTLPDIYCEQAVLLDEYAALLSQQAEWPSDAAAELVAACKERDEAHAAWDRLEGSRRQYPGPEYQRARKADVRYVAALQSVRPPVKPDAVAVSDEVGAPEYGTPAMCDLLVRRCHELRREVEEARHARQVPDVVPCSSSPYPLPPGYRLGSRDGVYWPLKDSEYITDKPDTRAGAVIVAWQHEHEKLLNIVQRVDAALPAPEKD